MNFGDLRFYNPFVETEVTASHLPHWQQQGAVYFLTFRMADAVPKHLLDRWNAEREAWLVEHPEPWSAEEEAEYHQRFSGAIERWLDAGHGSCALRDPACRAEVAKVLRYFDGIRCALISWVIMPNHVHVLFVLNEAWPLDKLVQSWKRQSSREVNRLLGKEGTFWQKDYFDRLVRDGNHFANCVRYIRRNPVKAKLPAYAFTLWESDLAQSIL